MFYAGVQAEQVELPELTRSKTVQCFESLSDKQGLGRAKGTQSNKSDQEKQDKKLFEEVTFYRA